MLSLIVLFGFFGISFASVITLSPTLYTAAFPISTQYHAQNALGLYSYGYSGGPSAKSEYNALDGVTRGSYSFVDPDGELQRVEYTADSLNGFRASATNLPKAPIDDKKAPEPVQDTPEVALAKAEHFAAYREAELRAAEQPDESSSGQFESSNSNGNSAQNLNENGNSNGNGNGNSNGNGNGNSQLSKTSDLKEEPLQLRSQENTNEAESQENGNTLSGNEQQSIFSLANGNSGLTESNVQLSDRTPATTSELRPVTLQSIQLPARSYYQISTPTHGFSVISPTLFASSVHTLRNDPHVSITKSLPLSLSTTYLSHKN